MIVYVYIVFLEQVGGADDGDEASQAITIKVKDGAGEELQFKVKKSTRMEKIFEAYAGRKGISSASLRFSLDGEKINPDATPKMLELEDNDQIDGKHSQLHHACLITVLLVFLQQTGGHV